MKNLITLSFISLLLFVSCKKERLSANGNLILETRSPGTFTGIQTSGSSPIHIIYGSKYKVVIKGSSNLVSYFESKIVNDKLYLDFDNINVKINDIEVTVTMPAIKKISLSGSAKIDVMGAFPHIDFINLAISGSGDILLSSYLTSTLANIDISGSGTINFGKLTTLGADVSISGSGDAYISVNDRLDAKISGSGKIYYGGNPVVESHISGSGKVIKL